MFEIQRKKVNNRLPKALQAGEFGLQSESVAPLKRQIPAQKILVFAGFLFFLIKGLLWLTLPVLFVLYGIIQ